jgi:hypothetical protein
MAMREEALHPNIRVVYLALFQAGKHSMGEE